MARNKMTLDELVQQLKAAHGEALEAVVLHGSAARHQGAPTGALDVLVIVRALADGALRAAGAATRAWMEAGHPAPLTLTSAEWRSSADIFAIEYADILSAHRVLHGALATDGIAVTRHDLRLQLEREAMGKLLQLRREMQARHGDGKAQRALLEGARGGIFALFRAALRLGGGVTRPHADSEAVAREVAVLAGLDAAPFLALVAHARGTKKIADAEAPAVMRGCHDGLERFAGWLDQQQTIDDRGSPRGENLRFGRSPFSRRDAQMRRRALFLLLPLVLAGCGYNTIQTYDESAAKAKQDIEVQLQRRADLVPNLVNTVKGFATQEQEVFVKVTEARAGLTGAIKGGKMSEMADANQQLTGALSRLMVTVEAYPQLKSDQNFLQLQDELTGTENRIAVARKDYNEMVATYNAYIRKFPQVLTAKVTGAKSRDYFEVSNAAAREAPTVDFGKKP